MIVIGMRNFCMAIMMIHKNNPTISCIVYDHFCAKFVQRRYLNTFIYEEDGNK